MRSLYVATDSVYGAREKGMKRLLDLMLEQLDRRYLFFFFFKLRVIMRLILVLWMKYHYGPQEVSSSSLNLCI